MIDRDAQRAYLGIDGPSMNYIELEVPLHLKKPSRIGVQLMGDLFHKSVSSMFINSIVGIMTAEETGHHTFFVLTKRPQNMEAYFKNFTKCGVDLVQFIERVWLGVSVEDQKTADERIPILLQIPATKRFVSVEPMLQNNLLIRPRTRRDPRLSLRRRPHSFLSMKLTLPLKLPLRLPLLLALNWSFGKGRKKCQNSK
jgi:hypothetical protein